MNRLILLLVCLWNAPLSAQSRYFPTVVHVLFYDASEDMSQQEVQELIDHANEGLSGHSTNNTVSRLIFDTLWADTGIRLCLADRDEHGNAATGVIHHQLSSPIAEGDFFRTKGESLPWNTDRYLNVWISSMGPTSELYGGVATTPTVTHSNFPNPYIGVMINRESYNYRQIFIHEIGHFFGLDHLYFDDIDDTPCSHNAINPEPACDPGFLTLNTCSQEASMWGSTNPPDMIENYMEYYGNCSKMFTRGQRDYMDNYIGNYYTAMLEGNQSACQLINPVSDTGINPAATVYPNPADDRLDIDMPGSFQVALFDLNGRRILHGSGVDHATLHPADLPEGLYFLSVKGGRFGSTYKIVIRHAR